MPYWTLPVAMLLLAVMSPMLAWWGSNRYYIGRWEEQSRSTTEWRVAIEKRMDSVDSTLKTISYATVAAELLRIKDDVIRLREWQESEGIAYIRAVDVLNERVKSLEGSRR